MRLEAVDPRLQQLAAEIVVECIGLAADLAAVASESHGAVAEERDGIDRREVARGNRKHLAH